MTNLTLSFAAPSPVVLTASPGLSLAFPAPQAVTLQESPALALSFAPPATVSLVTLPGLSLAFPAPQEVSLQVQGIQGPAGADGANAAGADSFETVSKNLAAVDSTGEQISTSTLVITYANGITKTIVDGGSTVICTLAGATPGGIDLIKTITLTGDDFAIAYS